MTKIIRPLRSGQITIPIQFRKELGIDEHSLLQLTLDAGELRLTPVRVEAKGSPWVRVLHAYFAPVRQEAIDKNLSEEEIDDAIDQAVQGVRAAHD